MATRALPIAPSCSFRLECARLRLAQFDVGGVLYHARYFNIYEEAREELFIRHGVSPYELTANRQYLAVVEAHQQFAAPIRYGDNVAVDIWASDLSRSAVRFDYLLSLAHGSPTPSERTSAPLHWGWTRHAFVAPRGDTLRPERLPEPLLAVIKRFLVPPHG